MCSTSGPHELKRESRMELFICVWKLCVFMEWCKGSALRVWVHMPSGIRGWKTSAASQLWACYGRIFPGSWGHWNELLFTGAWLLPLSSSACIWFWFWTRKPQTSFLLSEQTLCLGPEFVLTKLVLHAHENRVHVSFGCIEFAYGPPRADQLLCQDHTHISLILFGSILYWPLHFLLFPLDIWSTKITANMTNPLKI